MFVPMLLTASFAFAAPGDITKEDQEAAWSFAQKLQRCEELFSPEKCLGTPTWQQIGMGTGKERVQDWLEGRELTLDVTERGVTLTEGRVLAYTTEMERPVRSYLIVDLDDDGRSELLFETSDGLRWLVPHEEEERSSR